MKTPEELMPRTYAPGELVRVTKGTKAGHMFIVGSARLEEVTDFDDIDSEPMYAWFYTDTNTSTGRDDLWHFCEDNLEKVEIDPKDNQKVIDILKV